MTRFLHRSVFLCLALLLALSGCGKSGDPALAEQAVPSFHEQYNARKFSLIYADSADAFKEASSEKDFTALLEAMHRKLGVTETITPRSKHVTYGTGGTAVTLIYLTKYVKGEATEQFTYHLEENAAKLAGYHVTYLEPISEQPSENTVALPSAAENESGVDG